MKNYSFVVLFVITFGGVVQAAQWAPNKFVARPVAETKEAATMTVAKAVATDYKKACPVFLKTEAGDLAYVCWDLACKGEVEAQYRLACCCDAGSGVERNELFAYIWFAKASAKGDVAASLAVAGCYHLGIGVPMDVMHAASLYVAADLAFQKENLHRRLRPACFALEKIYNQLALDAKDERLIRLYRKSAVDYGNEGVDGYKLGIAYFSFWDRGVDLFRRLGDEKKAASSADSDKAVAPVDSDDEEDEVTKLLATLKSSCDNF